MFEVTFGTRQEMTDYCRGENLDFEQDRPMPVEGEYLYTRYRLIKDGLVVGQAVIDPRSDYLVAEGAACPACGENRMDWLTWDSDGKTVTCGGCDTVYTPD